MDARRRASSQLRYGLQHVTRCAIWFAIIPADLIVTVHPIATSFALRALGRNRPPFFTVVTDLVTTHALWFDTRADRIFVPTELARQRASS